MQLNQVTKDQFYKAIGPQDIITSIQGRYTDNPHGYITLFTHRSGLEVGRIHDRQNHPEYFLLQPGKE